MSEEGFGGTKIQLQNPVSNEFPNFIVGNAAEYEKRFPSPKPRNIYLPGEQIERPIKWWQKGLRKALGKPTQAFDEGPQIRLPYCDRVVRGGSGEGKTVVICGAGPSLAEHAAKWCPRGDEVWGCNSALTYLYENGHKVTHGFTIDQTPHMLTEWRTTPDVKYMLASTVHPHLTDMLLSKERDVEFFHNFVGIKLPPVSWPDENGVTQTEAWEDWAYQLMYEGTVRAGSGLNAVSRAIDVALYMGFKEIIVLGADCCLRFKSPPPDGYGPGSLEFEKWLIEETTMHADGGHALASGATPMVLTGKIDGRLFAVKPDLIITAVWLVIMQRQLKGRLRIIGDGLPKALRHKSREFLERLPTLVDSKGQSVPIDIEEDYAA